MPRNRSNVAARERRVPHQSDERGITVLELVAVVLIIAILGSIMASKLPDGNSIALSTQAQTLASDLRRAQTLAMSTGKPTCLKRIGNAAQYGIYETTQSSGVTTCSQTSVTDPLTNQPRSLLIKDPITGQPSLVALDERFSLTGNDCVIFNSIGKIYSPPTVTANTCIASQSSAMFCVKSGDEYRVVTVDALTGIVALGDRGTAVPTICTGA